MNRRPLTIEFTGLPNSGKTTLIHNLESSLLAQGINVQIMQEDAELVPKEIPKKTWIRNVWITFGQLQSLLGIPYSQADIILFDRGYCDALFWANFLFKQNVCSKAESSSLLKILHEMNNSFCVFPDYLFVIDVSVEESLKRRYASGGDAPVLTNQEFLNFYKKELDCFYETVTCPMWYLDTSNMTIDKVKNNTLKKIMQLLDE